MALDKTKTIRQRRVDVYLPSLEARQAWRDAAKQRGQTVSTMAYQLVEAALTHEAVDEDHVRSLEEANQRLLAEQAGLRARIEQLEALVQAKEKDLQEYRAMDFLETSKPVKEIDPRLIGILSEATTHAISDAEIREKLGIGADRQVQMQALAVQLEFLELHEVIRSTEKGWTWRG